MRKQISIKLNRQRYQSLIDDIKEKCKFLINGDNEVVALSIFYCHLCCTRIIEDGKTRNDIVCEYFGIKKEEDMISILAKFKKFNNSYNRKYTNK